MRKLLVPGSYWQSGLNWAPDLPANESMTLLSHFIDHPQWGLTAVGETVEGDGNPALHKLPVLIRMGDNGKPLD